MIKYDARAGRISRDDQDITQGFSAVMDLGQVDVGWIRFASMQAPDFVLVRAGNQVPDRPSKDHKRGMRLMCVLARSAGGDMREFSSAAGCVIEAVDELHDTYSSAPEAAQGKLPIVALTGSSPVKTNTPNGTTTNYKPLFSITGWVDRPDALPLNDGPAAPAARPAAAAQPAAQAAPANHVPPPGAKPAAGAGAGAGSEF
jgi:hypothetical protein